MAMRRASQAASGRHAAIGRGLPFAAESSGGGSLCLGRRPCRKAMRRTMIARLLVGLQITARWQRSAAHYGRQITSCSRFSGGQRGMIIKQFAALTVLALALSGCATSLNNASAGGATAHDPHWCREHRLYRSDLAWHLHHCGGWCTPSGCGH
jgi:hypothetical protein